MPGKLFIIATPIGNLKDITLRALETLKLVDYILCEDTRVTKKLLNHYQINKSLISYHQHSLQSKVKEIQQLLEQGNSLALVTDAGTPGISDPGNQLIQSLAIQQYNNITIIPIPGATAVAAALSVSGFPTDKFVFLGFPPHKTKRQKFFKELAEAKYTTVFYESPHRIKKCLVELTEHLGPGRRIVVCRELTKQFESVYRGSVTEAHNMDIPEKGEFVVVIASS